MLTSAYALFADTLRAVSFGGDLRRLRGKATGLDVARAALGEQSTANARRDFANYLSKIEHDQVPNVGLAKIRLIAKGMGYKTLATFFAELEATAQNLQSGSRVSTNGGRGSVEAADGGTSVSSAADIADLQAQVHHLAFQVEHLTDELAHIAAEKEHAARRRERVPTTSHRKPVRPRNAGKTG